MAKYVLNLTLNIVLFSVTMLIVSVSIPYDGLVNGFMREHVTLDAAEKIGKFILGEKDPEPYDSVKDWLSLLINTVISIPLFSLVVTAFNIVTDKDSFSHHMKESLFLMTRVFFKISSFTFLFWVIFRLLPYQHLFPEHTEFSTLEMMAILVFNLLVTCVCYSVIYKKLTIKRSL